MAEVQKDAERAGCSVSLSPKGKLEHGRHFPEGWSASPRRGSPFPAPSPPLGRSVAGPKRAGAELASPRGREGDRGPAGKTGGQARIGTPEGREKEATLSAGDVTPRTGEDRC